MIYFAMLAVWGHMKDCKNSKTLAPMVAILPSGYGFWTIMQSSLILFCLVWNLLIVSYVKSGLPHLFVDLSSPWSDISCCVFPPANRCSACRSLVKIIYFALKQVFSYFSVTNRKKERKAVLKHAKTCNKDENKTLSLQN